ncbi:MAG: twin-arginine translocase subunit TatC, partial [Ekhidna sp.]
MPLDQMSDEKEMSFLDHLEELRWHIIRSLIAISVFA